MPYMPICRLSDRSVLEIKGPDAEAFLQGLITNDMHRLRDLPAIYAGLLTPQGKILVDFHVVVDGSETFLVDVASTLATDLLSRLKMYRLRSKVEISDLSTQRGVVAIWGDAHVAAAPPGARAYEDRRAPGLGSRMIVDLEDAPAGTGQAAFQHHIRQLGVPGSADIQGEFALDANFEELGAVDFRKGCFVGQEVTARMKHKAQPRKRLVPVELDADAELGPIQDEAGLAVGELKSISEGVGIAILRLDRLQGRRTFTCGDSAVTVRLPAYELPALTRALEAA